MAQTSEQQAPTTGISDAVVEWRRETLERAGLDAERAEKIAASDADLHEAITEVPVQDPSKAGTVIDEVEKGYSLNDKIIRFAKVVVGK